ncbi:putative ribonuclease H protein [Senna tora]|uniref:Putative ribonuclease H protein n=1 Tax=Senna tora TaxID=362788 RepID=A0A835CM07_9FABA|nr:putative ribonuclease H protein [Senna tora]
MGEGGGGKKKDTRPTKLHPEQDHQGLPEPYSTLMRRLEEGTGSSMHEASHRSHVVRHSISFAVCVFQDNNPIKLKQLVDSIDNRSQHVLICATILDKAGSIHGVKFYDKKNTFKSCATSNPVNMPHNSANKAKPLLPIFFTKPEIHSPFLFLNTPLVFRLV